jgi:uncharacterized protein (TIGR02246 family)
MSFRPRVLLYPCAFLVPLLVACEPAAEEPAVFPAEEPAPIVEAPPAEVQTAIDRYVAAWNGDDPEAVAAFFTEDATVVVDDDTYRGHAEIVEGWLPTVPAVSNLRVTDQMVERVGNDWRGEGTYAATIAPPDEEAMETTGRYTVVWTLGPDGQWRIRSSEVHADEPTDG